MPFEPGTEVTLKGFTVPATREDVELRVATVRLIPSDIVIRIPERYVIPAPTEPKEAR